MVELALQLRELDWAHGYATKLVERAPKDALARLALGAVLSAQGDHAAARATALAVLDDTPTQPGALSVLTVMARTPAQRQELMARHAKALAAGGAGPQQVLDYVALLRFEPVAGTTPLAVLEQGVQRYPSAVALRAALVEQLLRDGQTEPALAAAQSGANPAPRPRPASCSPRPTCDWARPRRPPRRCASWRPSIRTGPSCACSWPGSKRAPVAAPRRARCCAG